MYAREDAAIVVFVAGANVGDYTAAAVQRLGARARLFAFEPSAETFRVLSRNVGSMPHVVLRNCGFGERSESRTLYSNEDGSGIASVYARDLRHLATALDHREQIELRAIDDVMTELGVERVHLLKLDIEGHELSALRGAQRALTEGRIDLVQFEFGGCNIDSRSYLRDFRDLLGSRYVLHRMVRGGLRALPRYAELQEIFVTTNFVAVRSELADALRRAL
jgi:FkbM family methyltransferase